ncbi:hypothetical protein EZV73_27750 [Acidaminobacter sp. JC074]|nr:hypothetical protein [Acidaminobacter sp. JC074]
MVSIDINKDVDLDNYISKADRLMYQAKEKGRNRIEFRLSDKGEEHSTSI